MNGPQNDPQRPTPTDTPPAPFVTSPKPRRPGGGHYRPRPLCPPRSGCTTCDIIRAREGR